MSIPNKVVKEIWYVTRRCTRCGEREFHDNHSQISDERLHEVAQKIADAYNAQSLRLNREYEKSKRELDKALAILRKLAEEVQQ